MSEVIYFSQHVTQHSKLFNVTEVNSSDISKKKVRKIACRLI